MSAPYGEIALVHEGGNLDSYKVVLRSSKAIESQKEKIQSSASTFEKCLSAVSNISGNATSLLKGDGEPVEEDGYKSFFIKGLNNDQFFCEVHRGNKYKIKAALNGKYPFKYIDEGKFQEQ